MNYSLPGSSVYGISQARILEWVTVSFYRGSSWPRDQTHVSRVSRETLYHWATKEGNHYSLLISVSPALPMVLVISQWVKRKLLSSVQLFWDPMDCSLPGSSVYGISQARILEWAAASFFRGSSPPRDRSHIFCVSRTGRQTVYRWVTGEAHHWYYILNP